MKALPFLVAAATLSFSVLATADSVIQPKPAVRMPSQYNVSCDVLDSRSDYNKLFMVAHGATADLYAKNKSMFGISIVYYGVELVADANSYEIKGTLGTLGAPIDLDAKVVRGGSSRVNVMGYEFDCQAD